MDSRKQFEERFPVPFNADWSDEHQRYVWNKESNSLTAAMEHSKLWESWQASRESLEVDLGSMTNNGYEGFYPANQIKRALRDSGIRTK